MHISLFRHNLNFHFYYQARHTLSEFIVSQPLLVFFNYFILQNFGLISMHICSLTLFIFKIVLRTFPVKFWLATYKFANNSLRPCRCFVIYFYNIITAKRRVCCLFTTCFKASTTSLKFLDRGIRCSSSKINFWDVLAADRQFINSSVKLTLLQRHLYNSISPRACL